MGGKQTVFEAEAYYSSPSPAGKLFEDPGNPYGKSQDEKLNDLRNECRKFYKHYGESSEKLWEFLTQAVSDIADLKKENDFLKQQIMNGSSGKWGVYASKDEMKCQFDDYRQMQILLKQNCDKLESKFEAASNGLAVVKPTIDIKPPVKIEAPKDDLDGWMKMDDLIAHLKELCKQGKIKIDSSYLIRGHINKLYIRLHLVKIINTTGAMQVSGTKLGKQSGYVMGVNSGKTHLTYYNVEKCVKLLESCSTPESLIKTMDVFDEKDQQHVVAE